MCEAWLHVIAANQQSYHLLMSATGSGCEWCMSASGLRIWIDVFAGQEEAALYQSSPVSLPTAIGV